ncbi:glycine-rich protein family [Trichomonas vaginalis G3]|uniref:glycine-rich protein family n=1 Tax=Trichomonas vaginalis (strain ATCC PRA-98 / G3) TaxID=412133 RepID=UPI0021E5A38F|nr:glycine-rich protein family [Trichomonas vaginalis G3]KAI5505953.1 glycine-rich protein family [Trichomonas vaginalis G3]
MISYELQQKSDVNASKNVSINGRQYIFDFPCDDTSICTDYVVRLPRGTYKFELYGASGGSARGKVSSYRYENKSCISEETVRLMHGNTECIQQDSIGGAGGYLSGTITLKHPTLSYFTIGGKGVFGYKPGYMTEEENFQKENMQPGGYGGGGSSSNYFRGTGSGGGQTTVKFIENDLWHRVLVSGAGGGCDDYNADDGSGGAGGNLVAQGWFFNGNYVENYLANSTFGFSFGQGEAARYGSTKHPHAVPTSTNTDIGGAGGGWFGGFSSQSGSGGAGGGSSFALTKDAIIPQGNISAYDEFYNLIDSKPYSFNLNSEFLFKDVIHIQMIYLI